MRLRGLGLGDRARVLNQDYRDTTGGPYDAIASLEMGEHVGADGYPAFCAALHRLLRPGGRLLIQQMSRGRHAPGGGAFIESYVTADMHMRPVGETVGLLEEAGLEVLGVQALRPHYVRTIRAWLANSEREPARGRGHHRPGARPAVAAVSRGRRAGIRRGPDGRRPDTRGEARAGMTPTTEGARQCSRSPDSARHRLARSSRWWPRPSRPAPAPAGTASWTRPGARGSRWRARSASSPRSGTGSRLAAGRRQRAAVLWGVRLALARGGGLRGAVRGSALPRNARPGAGESELVRAAHGLPAATADPVGGLRAAGGRKMTTSGGGRPGHRRSAASSGWPTSSSRSSATGSSRRFRADPANKGTAHGPRAVAVHQAPEPRGTRHVVGRCADELRFVHPTGDRGVAPAHDVHPDPGHRPAADRSPDGGIPSWLRRLRRPDQRVHPACERTRAR